MLSETWSQILSGWPTVTDSEENRRRDSDVLTGLSYRCVVKIQYETVTRRSAVILMTAEAQ